jgi:transcriptional regulator of acetoin/glycerol metabolism
MRYDFPGNVRELENFIEYAFILCHGAIIEVDHLPKELRNHHLSGINGGQPGGPAPLARSEEETVRQALVENDWNRTLTAAYLRINPTTLWRKMKKYGIKAP